jgi:hypothetical protein
MKTGMEMMLASMGIDTDAIRKLLDPENIKQLLHRVEKSCNTIESIDARLLRIEVKLETLPPDVAMRLLADNRESAEKEAAEYARNNSDGNRSN